MSSKDVTQKMSQYFAKTYSQTVEEKPEAQLREESLAVNDPVEFVKAVKAGETEYVDAHKMKAILQQQAYLNAQKALLNHQKAFDSQYRESQYHAAIKAKTAYEVALEELRK